MNRGFQESSMHTVVFLELTICRRPILFEHNCTFNTVAPFFITFWQMFARLLTASACLSLLLFCIDRPIAWINSPLAFYWVPLSASFTLVNRLYGRCSRISHYQWRKRSVTAAVWFLALLWRMMVFCTTKCRCFLQSTCDYDLFTKVKEPLRGTRYNTRDEFIHAIGRSIQNINKDGHIDGVQQLPNIWKNVINKGDTILKVHKCCTPVNKAMSGISNCFYPTLVYN